MSYRLAFNCWIMLNFFGCAAWWAYQRSWVDTAYWLSALAITATVTFGYNH
jgi:hypothetical protein